MRVLVTGANGFVGRPLVHDLARAGFQVRAAARNMSRSQQDAGIEAVALPDLSGTVDWRPLVAGMDAVVHLAGIAHAGGGIPEARYDNVNRAATRSLAEETARQKTGRLIFVSSIRAQSGPASERVLREGDEPQPTNAYGRSKLAAEQAVEASGAAFTILRPVVMYGPGVKGNFASLLRLAASSWPLPLGALRRRRSLLAVDNMISAIEFVLRNPQTAGETYIVADRSPLSMREIVTIMRAAMGRPARLVPVPKALFSLGLTAIGRRDLWERLGGQLVADPRKLLGAGWEPAVETRAALASWISQAGRGVSAPP
ncbi:MAG: NAD-dependent epimerase/dehydratase family protein [Pseudorhodoplanes sp.]|nr:MAG: NAD-dependent epimerase/dehydratase family protein [Pseudorhodoplanes sp.]